MVFTPALDLPPPTHAPSSMEALHEAATALRQDQLVVLHIGGMSREQAQRAVDCLSGFTYALGGAQRRLGPELYSFAPPTWQPTAEHRELFDRLIRTPSPPASDLWSEVQPAEPSSRDADKGLSLIHI